MKPNKAHLGHKIVLTEEDLVFTLTTWNMAGFHNQGFILK